MVRFIFMFFILLYWISESETEGFTWASPQRRLQNKLICDHFGVGNGILCYHAWRYGENIGILGSILCGFFFTSFWSLLLTAIGSCWVGVFLYERGLNYVVYDKLFLQKSDFTILWWSFKRHTWHDFALLIVGLILIIIGLC